MRTMKPDYPSDRNRILFTRQYGFRICNVIARYDTNGNWQVRTVGDYISTTDQETNDDGLYPLVKEIFDKWIARVETIYHRGV